MGVRHSDDRDRRGAHERRRGWTPRPSPSSPPAHRDGARGVPPPPRLGRRRSTARRLRRRGSRRSFRDEANGSALPWLFGIALNVARESARKDAVETRRRLGLPTDLASEDGYAAVEERFRPAWLLPAGSRLARARAGGARAARRGRVAVRAGRRSPRRSSGGPRGCVSPGRPGLSSLALKEDT